MTYQSALITGASSGIGAAFARALPRATALLLTGRDRDRLKARAQELGLNGRQVRTVVADLTDAEGRYAVIGAWIVGDVAAGVGIREDDSPITKNTSRFVPQYFE